MGAAITTAEGDVLAVGMNEVPSQKGGPYWCGDSIDERDHQRSVDPNAEHRGRIAKNIATGLTNEIVSVPRLSALVMQVLSDLKVEADEEKLTEVICTKLNHSASLLDEQRTINAVNSSDLKAITEYGRAVHGEMDAILTCARLGISVRGAYLYATTFPCHNCTRHIIASGIRRVYYVEPYPKSKAHDLHSDAICFDEKEAEESGRIPFLPFIGVGPRRYLDFFSLELSSGRPIHRKGSDDKPFIPSRGDRPPRVPLIPLSYLEREDKLLDDYKDIIERLQGKAAIVTEEPDMQK